MRAAIPGSDSPGVAKGAAGRPVPPPSGDAGDSGSRKGCGGVGIVIGGRRDGRGGAATPPPARAALGAAAAAATPKSSSIAPRSPIAITPPQTEQRARMPLIGTLAGSTRKIDPHSGQVTFMRADSPV
ncbi:MAG TPA: hypothetical protein VEL75_08260 [Candidatus Methylomirabilis sp.]|nr:hypothetical protein [Candidatus Methylomirabilis sp.]